MAAREEVFDLLAGFDVPIGHPMRLHDRDVDVGFLEEGVMAMTDIFHDAESHLGFDSLQNEIGHDIVAAPDDAVDVGDTIEDQVFGVALPNVGAVAQARDDEKVVERLGLRLAKHSLGEVRAKFRKG